MEVKIKEHVLHLYNEDHYDQVILWIMGQHEKCYLDFLSQNLNCLLIAFEVKNWNDDLSPWYAPAVFKGDDFKGNGQQTYQIIVDDLIPYLQCRYQYDRIYIAGYSLAGLFSLYVLHQCDIFAGVASCSGSLWYKDIDEFVKRYPQINKKIYLSLGDKENQTRNQMMASIKEKTEKLYQIEKLYNICTYKLNKGNHFQNIQYRLLDGMLWLLKGENK